MKLRLSEQQLQQQVRYFAYYQLVSGIVALILIAVLLAQLGSVTGLLLLVFVSFLGLAAFTIYCGYLAWKRPLPGLQLSRISLLIQFLSFAVGGFSFRFFAGPFLAISLDLTKDLSFNVEAALAGVNFTISSEPGTLFISVNLVAMLLFLRTTLWLNDWNARYSGTPAR